MPQTCNISIHLKTSEVLFNSRLAETEGLAHEGRHEQKHTVIYNSSKCGLPTIATFFHQQRLRYQSWRYFVTLLFSMLRRFSKSMMMPLRKEEALSHYVTISAL